MKIENRIKHEEFSLTKEQEVLFDKIIALLAEEAASKIRSRKGKEHIKSLKSYTPCSAGIELSAN
jgi:flagellar basal body-associated protein FliL